MSLCSANVALVQVLGRVTRSRPIKIMSSFCHRVTYVELHREKKESEDTAVKPEEEVKEVTEKLSNGVDKAPEKPTEAAADSETPATPDTPASPESATESSDKKKKDKSKRKSRK
uniref:Uncharacterized protein n=1 Tax=Cacopsylla melanoneura TaxID=428564 RepID=A0A8D8RQK8_9HEMI